MATKRYLGDGVFADNDGHMLILTVSDGTRASHTIYLEPNVLDALLIYVGATRKPEDPEDEDDDGE